VCVCVRVCASGSWSHFWFSLPSVNQWTRLPTAIYLHPSVSQSVRLITLSNATLHPHHQWQLLSWKQQTTKTHPTPRTSLRTNRCFLLCDEIHYRKLPLWDTRKRYREKSLKITFGWETFSNVETDSLKPKKKPRPDIFQFSHIQYSMTVLHENASGKITRWKLW